MLGKLQRLFRPDTVDGKAELNLKDLDLDLHKLIVRNRCSLTKNEDLISRIEDNIKVLAEDLSTKTEMSKRCVLRTIARSRRRIKRLSRCSSIYNDNINFQAQISDRLEEMRVSGLKTITPIDLEELALDHEELYANHRDMIKSFDVVDRSDILIDDDEDLKALEKEICGTE